MRAVEVNALVKAINLATSDENRLLEMAVSMNAQPVGTEYRFTVRGDASGMRLVAHPKQAPVSWDLQHVLGLVATAAESVAAQEAAHAYLGSLPWVQEKEE